MSPLPLGSSETGTLNNSLSSFSDYYYSFKSPSKSHPVHSCLVHPQCLRSGPLRPTPHATARQVLEIKRVGLLLTKTVQQLRMVLLGIKANRVLWPAHKALQG